MIDPSTPLAYLTQGVKHGGDYRFNTEVTGAERVPTGWRLTSNRGEFHGKIVINCAGNQGDRVESFAISPSLKFARAKGSSVFDKAAAGQVNAIILPVPTAITKGGAVVKPSSAICCWGRPPKNSRIAKRRRWTKPKCAS